MTLREKLLAAIDPEDFRENVSDSVLLDLVLDQLSATKAALVASRNALLKEGMRADEARRDAREEIRRARKDPTYFVSGRFLFVDAVNPSLFYAVDIYDGDVRLYRRQGNIDYCLPRITRDEYLKRMENT